VEMILITNTTDTKTAETSLMFTNRIRILTCHVLEARES
jgi:hypothetical protein